MCYDNLVRNVDILIAAPSTTSSYNDGNEKAGTKENGSHCQIWINKSQHNMIDSTNQKDSGYCTWYKYNYVIAIEASPWENSVAFLPSDSNTYRRTLI